MGGNGWGSLHGSARSPCSTSPAQRVGLRGADARWGRASGAVAARRRPRPPAGRLSEPRAHVRPSTRSRRQPRAAPPSQKSLTVQGGLATPPSARPPSGPSSGGARCARLGGGGGAGRGLARGLGGSGFRGRGRERTQPREPVGCAGCTFRTGGTRRSAHAPRASPPAVRAGLARRRARGPAAGAPPEDDPASGVVLAAAAALLQHAGGPRKVHGRFLRGPLAGRARGGLLFWGRVRVGGGSATSPHEAPPRAGRGARRTVKRGPKRAAQTRQSRPPRLQAGPCRGSALSRRA